MTLKDDLIEKLETQIDAWDKEIEAQKKEAQKKEAQAKTQKAGAEIEAGIKEQVDALQDKMAEAGEQIKQIREAGEAGLEDLKSKVNRLLV